MNLSTKRATIASAVTAVLVPPLFVTPESLTLLIVGAETFVVTWMVLSIFLRLRSVTVWPPARVRIVTRFVAVAIGVSVCLLRCAILILTR